MRRFVIAGNWKMNGDTAGNRELVAGIVDGSAPSEAVAELDAFEAWPERRGRGRVVDSFWSAWDAFANADGYRAAVVAAVDKFRGSATAAEVAAAIGHACWERSHDCVEVPMADGGDGLRQALAIGCGEINIAIGGTMHRIPALVHQTVVAVA